MTDEDTSWHRCSGCKKPIPYGSDYWKCSVSTCNQKRTALHFCSVSCWEVHLPIARHREAWAEEARAPSRAEADAQASAPARPRKRRVVPSGGVSSSAPSEPASTSERRSSDEAGEVLIIGSRLKAHIKSVSGLSTSDRVLEPLSAIIRDVCERAIRNAVKEGRKTVLDRDIPKP